MLRADLGGVVRRFLWLRVLRQHRLYPRQQAPLVTIAQSQLDLSAFDRDVAVHTCGCLWQGWGYWSVTLTMGAST